MAQRDEFELRVVEVVEALPERNQRERPAPAEHRVATAHEVVEALKASKGSAALADQIPMRPELWEMVGYFDVNGWSGPAATGLILWDADFSLYTMLECTDFDFAFFGGAEWPAGSGAPGTATGRACCFFRLPGGPEARFYIISVQLQRVEPFYDHVDPVVAFFIDDIPMGELQWQDTRPINQPLTVSAAPGFHRFDVRQVSGSYRFWNVTIWRALPESVDDPGDGLFGWPPRRTRPAVGAAGDESGLRVAEAPEALSEPDQRERPAPAGHRGATAEEMVEALLASKGSASLTGLIPVRPPAWEMIGYFDVNGWSGPAAVELALYKADFDTFDIQWSLYNNFAFFSGAEWGTHFGAPGTVTGRACCFFKVPRADYYIISVQLQRLDTLYDPVVPVVAFFIDDIPMGELQWQDIYPINQVLVVHAAPGLHRFDVRQKWGSYHFLSVTIWTNAPPQSLDAP
jgi:hypothetical protein